LHVPAPPDLNGRRTGHPDAKDTLSQPDWSSTMIIRNTLAATIAAVALLSATGCAVTRDQETVGAYVDDATITTQIKSRMLSNKDVAGTSISVETLNGTVILSGFAKSSMERATAEKIARDVNGVKLVKNEIAVRS
jgi:osmotically-inducible protein OsmY